MDLRIERTKRSIANAYLELRKQKPLEKISVKELSELAFINKATFYTHYHDIFDLANQLETEFFSTVLSETNYLDQLMDNPTLAVKELTLALSKARETSDILFSGSRKSAYAQKLSVALRNETDKHRPSHVSDLQWNVVLTILIQGCYHAFQSYSTEENMEEITILLGDINQFICDKFL